MAITVDIPIDTKRLKDLKYPSKMDLVYRILVLIGFDEIYCNGNLWDLSHET
jgi:hypothetical protein